MDAQAALSALVQLYADFMEDYAQADRPGWLERLLQGGPSRAERKTIADFYDAVQSAVETLRAELTPADSGVAARAVRFLILDAEGNDPSTRLTVAATQALAIPLLDHVSPSEAAELLAGYQARYPKKRLLTPRQAELLTALERSAHT